MNNEASYSGKIYIAISFEQILIAKRNLLDIKWPPMKGPRVKIPLASPLPWSKTSALIGHWSEGLLKSGLSDFLHL